MAKPRQQGTPAEPTFTRSALAPGLLGAIALLAGLALLGSDGFLVIRFVVSILAVILSVFVIQSKAWWWLVGLVPIAIVWNPVVVIELHGQGWAAAQFVAALVFIVVGVRTKVPVQQK